MKLFHELFNVVIEGMILHSAVHQQRLGVT